MYAWKIIALIIVALLWVGGAILASVAPTEEEVIEYRKHKAR